MNNRERFKNVEVLGSLTVGGEPIVAGPRVVGGKASITGSGQIPTGLTSISLTLGQDPGLGASAVSGTWSGSTITAKVSRPTSAGDATPIPATVPAVVHWQATGN